MITAKQIDRAISNIKYRFGKFNVRMGLSPLPKVRVCRDFSNPPPSGPLSLGAPTQLVSKMIICGYFFFLVGIYLVPSLSLE